MNEIETILGQYVLTYHLMDLRLKKILFFAVLSFTFGISSGQIRIDSIVFEGLKKTKPIALHRFLSAKQNSEVDTAALREDIIRLRNLNIFSMVKYDIRQINNRNILIYTCDEIVTTFPVFSFGSQGTQSFFKLGITNANFQGNLGIMRLYYINYDGNSIYYEHEFPYIKRSSFGLRADIKLVNRLEPLYFGDMQVLYKYQNRYLGLEGFKEFRQNHRFKTRLYLFNEMFERKDDMIDTVDFIEGDKCGVRLSHIIGKINYRRCNTDGFINEVSTNLIYAFNDVNFFQVINTFKYFNTFGRNTTMAFRFKTGLSSNNTGPFAPFAVDSYMNIRGVGYKIDRGTGQIVLNAEVRQNVINRKWGSVQGVGFADFGSWRLPAKPLNDFLEPENIKLYTGMGVRIYLARIYNMTLRADYGFSIGSLSENGVVIGIGQYF